MACSGRRSSCLARSVRARRSAWVSGGCRMLRGHNRRARTTLTSAPYSMTWALRNSHDISPSTTAKNPYTAWACLRLWPTRYPPSACSSVNSTPAKAAPTHSCHVGICRGVRTRKAIRNSPALTTAGAARLARPNSSVWPPKLGREASAVVATTPSPNTSSSRSPRSCLVAKLGRCLPGMFQISAMACWPAWVIPRAPHTNPARPMTRAMPLARRECTLSWSWSPMIGNSARVECSTCCSKAGWRPSRKPSVVTRISSSGNRAKKPFQANKVVRLPPLSSPNFLTTANGNPSQPWRCW